MRIGEPNAFHRTMRVTITLAILAWAMGALLARWAGGATVTLDALTDPAAGGVRFLPRDGGCGTASVELLSEASVAGEQVRLRDIARWAEADRTALQGAAEVAVAQLSGGAAQTVSLEQLKAALRQGGVNVALVNFSGAASCVVSRSAVAEVVPPAPVTQVAAAMNASAAPDLAPAASSPSRSLREILIADLAQRLGFAPESLQIDFTARDEPSLRLAEPAVRFVIESRRARSLGDVAWDVTVLSSGPAQRLGISARARAWQSQVFSVRAIAQRQVLRDEDLVEKRVLVDRLVDEAMASKAQALGQRATHEIPAGGVLTARLLEAVPLVQSGQLVSVSVEQGLVQINTVGEARESGGFGQTIRVRKPGTREEYDVVLTGPQAGRMVTPGAPRVGMERP